MVTASVINQGQWGILNIASGRSKETNSSNSLIVNKHKKFEIFLEYMNWYDQLSSQRNQIKNKQNKSDLTIFLSNI